MTDLRDAKRCDVLIVLTDSDEDRWQDVKRREASRIPIDCQHMSIFGVAGRNIECWLRLNRAALAQELRCGEAELGSDDPSGVVKSLWRTAAAGDDLTERVAKFVAGVDLRPWLNDDSFGDFYSESRALAARTGCMVPNEYESK